MMKKYLVVRTYGDRSTEEFEIEAINAKQAIQTVYDSVSEASGWYWDSVHFMFVNFSDTDTITAKLLELHGEK